jgi:hypothetical protein
MIGLDLVVALFYAFIIVITSLLQTIENFVFSKASRPTLGPTEPSVQWLLGLYLQG